MSLTASLPPRQADRRYHDLLAPQGTRDVRARVRKLAERAVAPHAAQIANGDERTDGFPGRSSTRWRQTACLPSRSPPMSAAPA